ncbi:hypothetical protein THASP1DRAFT_23491 [Thamnocephalis sphaerospora]|uniref:HMG box domain-containing protein n=1 Tax=Thamnocephalis sphaerospora TaxID=78915 RepID=A0A4P9XR45_9FUNG|nr:hypothetical protein THASP1DRAFT_23491 [Thamnocephalis sphaerospora]|eukprot:RKP08535.1 hypothetical protein THASP1DRAFT_23491 [Thamnocephalis sphaerospora]
MTRTKKIELPADVEPDTPIQLTAKDALELTQSYAALAEHSTRIARILGRAAGVPEDAILPGVHCGDALVNGVDTEGKKRKRDRDPDAPKRPPSSFLLFMADRRPILKKEHPDMSYSDLMKEISNMWKVLPDAQRTEYEKKYNESRTEFQKQQESYQAKKSAGVTTATPSKKTKPTAVSESEESESDSTDAEEEAAVAAKSKKTKPAAVSESESSESESAGRHRVALLVIDAFVDLPLYTLLALFALVLAGDATKEGEDESDVKKNRLMFTPPPVPAKKTKKPTKPAAEKKAPTKKASPAAKPAEKTADAAPKKTKKTKKPGKA